MKGYRKMDTLFIKGHEYTREQVCDILNVPEDQRKGNWYTGYTTYEGVYYLFVNIETAGRTGHNYNDHWLEDGSLYWHAKANANLYTPAVQRMISRDAVIHIFTRNDSRNVNFTYRGIGKLKSLTNEQPVQITWEIE